MLISVNKNSKPVVEHSLAMRVIFTYRQSTPMTRSYALHNIKDSIKFVFEFNCVINIQNEKSMSLSVCESRNAGELAISIQEWTNTDKRMNTTVRRSTEIWSQNCEISRRVTTRIVIHKQQYVFVYSDSPREKRMDNVIK